MKINKLAILALMTVSLIAPVAAKLNSKAVSTNLVEEAIVTVTGKSLTSKSNPFKVVLKTTDGQSLDLPTQNVSTEGKKAQFITPSIPDAVSANLIQAILEVSGGNVPAANPQRFVVYLAKRPANLPAEIDSTTAASLPVLATTTEGGIGAQGPSGPAGESGPAGKAGDAGSPGPQGPIPSFYPASSIVGTVNSAQVVTNASQTAITTLTNLVNVGTAGTTTTFAGPVAAPQGFVGDLTGTASNATNAANATNATNATNAANVTGASQSAITTLAGLTSFGTAGTTTTAQGPLAAPQGFTGALAGNVTGNLTGTVLTASQPNITTQAGLTSFGTAGTTTTAQGPLAVPQGITANLTGNVTGNVTGPVTGAVTGNVTGDLTGQVLTATQSSITTLPALISAGTAGVTTNLLGPVNAAQGFIGNLTGNLTGAILTAAQPSITTMAGLINAGTAGVQTQFQGPVRGVQGFIGDITGNVTGNVTGTATNATNAVNVTGAAQTSITSLPALAIVGTAGNTVNFTGSVGVAQNLTTAGTFTSTGNITAPLFIGNLQGLVNTAVQPNITTLAGVTNVGTAGVTTTFAGPVAAPHGFTGNLTGIASNATNSINATNATNVTGASQAAITTLVGLTNVGTAAVTTTFAGPVSAPQGITGAITGNVTGRADEAAEINDGINVLQLAGGPGTATVTIPAGASAYTLPSGGGTLVKTTSMTPIAIGTVDTAGADNFSATGLNLVTLSNSGVATPVISITGGVAGQRLTIVFAAPITLDEVGLSNLELSTSGAFNANPGSTIELIYSGTEWFEISRSQNN